MLLGSEYFAVLPLFLRLDGVFLLGLHVVRALVVCLDWRYIADEAFQAVLKRGRPQWIQVHEILNHRKTGG